MTFDDIIQNNCQNNSRIDWWPKYAFHYTDIENAVNILKTGTLYSRANAQRLGVMKNDNASRQVIDMTDFSTKAFVRFYFRPLTPTQYHNEGYKHSKIRYCEDPNANVPVPVFFLFDLAAVLNMEKVGFSETSQAGRGSRVCYTPLEMSQFDFKRIYDTGYMQDRSDIPYRQAEILYPGALPIVTSLALIVCRNQMERLTLLNLLRQQDVGLYNFYKDKVFAGAKDLFQNNGLYVENVQYLDDRLSITFSDTYQKRNYCRRYKKEDLDPVDSRLELNWLKNNHLYNKQMCKFEIDYEDPGSVTFSGLRKPSGVNVLEVKVFFENHIMCFSRINLQDVIFG